MATRRIKESYGPPVIPKDATPQQRQALMQGHRQHQDFVKQINDMRDAFNAEIAALKADPVVFAFALASTDGAGGVSTQFSYGCTISLAGASVRMTFSTTRHDVNYVHGAMSVGTILRVPELPAFTSASHTETFADTRFRNDLGGTISASATAIQFMLWAIGPRT